MKVCNFAPSRGRLARGIVHTRGFRQKIAPGTRLVGGSRRPSFGTFYLLRGQGQYQCLADNMSRDLTQFEGGSELVHVRTAHIPAPGEYGTLLCEIYTPGWGVIRPSSRKGLVTMDACTQASTSVPEL